MYRISPSRWKFRIDMQKPTSFRLFLAVVFVGSTSFDAGLASEHGRMRRTASDADSNKCSEVQSPVPPEISKNFKVNTTFYQKYITVYGIPTLSSGAVDDRALQRACYTVRFLLAGSEKLREGMRSEKARVSVLGSKETILKLPEFHIYNRIPWLASAWASIRGVGGTIKRPVTVVAQENLLSEASDGYHRNQDIAVHELAHAMHRIACKVKFPLFDKNLLKTYKNARKARLWDNTYAGKNHKEYFAMGMQSYLNQQYDGPRGGDGVYNNINNRTELMQYDRPLYDIIKKLLPCPNTFIPKSTDIDQSRGASEELVMDCDTAA